MDARLAMFALTAVLVSTVGMAPAFGQIQGPITVMTDKESYATGETIIVSGEVSQRLGFDVTLLVLAPNGNRVAADQLSIGPDRTFNTTLALGEGVLKFTGTYRIEVQYGDSDSRSAETTFEFTGGDAPRTPVAEDPAITEDTIRVDGATDLIRYSIEGGRILSVTPDTTSKSLIINIEATDDGMVTFTIPRSVLDATMDGADDDFFVLVDGEEPEFEETETTETHRTLVIQFPAGAQEIEIIGTFVIPEFGAIAAVILAAAIVAVVAVSARSRLSIMPRY